MAFKFYRYGYLPIREDDCSYVWNVPANDRCEWVKNTPDCISDSVIQYTKILFCSFDPENSSIFSLGLILLTIWLLYLFLILGTTADNFFCPSLAVIAAVMRLSDSIAGVTILAFGNGAPDIFTSLVSSADEGIIMFTELLGAGVFVTTMIAGSIAVVKPFRVPLKYLMRDTLFYTLSICWISWVVQDEKVHLWESFSFVLCYGLFIGAVIIMQMYESREEKLKSRIPNLPDPDILRTYIANKDIVSIPKIPMRKRAFGLQTKLDVAIATQLKSEYGNMPEKSEQIEDADRPKGLFREFLYDINPISKDDWTSSNWIFKFILIIRSPVMFVLQLFIPLVNATAVKRGWSKLLNCYQLCLTPTFALFILNVWRIHFGPVSIIPIFLAIGTTAGVIVFLMTHEDRIPKFHDVFAFLGFLTAMVVVYLIAGEVVAVLECVGYAFSISDAMLGITLLAWGNSVGDMISNIAIAKRGYPRMGFAACFGGPMFNTLLGMGLTYGKAALSGMNLYANMRMSDMAPGVIAFLLSSLLVTIIYFNITGGIARRSYGYTLYCIYFAFILIQFISELKLIHPLGIDHRP